MPGKAALVRTACAAPFVLFLAVYLPAAGHGLMLDDYSWILTSQVRSFSDFIDLFRTDNGFYRPVVAVTFSANEWMFGTRPLGYGVTNVLLALACGWLIVALARALAVPKGAAILAGALWLLNFQGTRTAVQWVSGRTVLVLILAATASALALVRGRTILALVFAALALFAKEEAVLLPVLLLGWIYVLRAHGRDTGIKAWVWIAGTAAILAVYFIARGSTGAMTIANAPAHYHLTLDPVLFVKNVMRYADRVLTTPLLLLIGALALLGRAKPLLDERSRMILWLGGLWLAGGFGLTLFIPTRSDLYACFPAVGVCLAAAAIAGRSWEQAPVTRQRRALVCLLVALVALSPIYYLRTERRTKLTEFAAATLGDLVTLTARLPPNATVVIDDDVGARQTDQPNLEDAFGGLLNDAYALMAGRRLRIRIEPAPPDLGPAPACATCIDLRLKVSGGRLLPRE
jgi:hypothetical protein